MGLTDLERKLLKAAGGNLTDPLAVTLAEASRLSGFSRSELYKRATRGELAMMKCGRRTLVNFASLKANIAALPKAEIHIANA